MFSSSIHSFASQSMSARLTLVPILIVAFAACANTEDQTDADQAAIQSILDARHDISTPNQLTGQNRRVRDGGSLAVVAKNPAGARVEESSRHGLDQSKTQTSFQRAGWHGGC